MKRKISIDLETNGLVGVISEFGVGKTTFLCVTAVEAYIRGKKVLYLTQEESEKHILRKMNKTLRVSDNELNGLMVKRFINLKTVITDIVKDNKFDLVYVDGCYDVDYDFLREISIKENVLFITSIQANRGFTGEAISLTPIRPMLVSDQIYSLTVKKEFKTFEKIKYFFCFWLKKPNRTLKVLKNRYGSYGIKKDLYLDLENCKIN